MATTPMPDANDSRWEQAADTLAARRGVIVYRKGRDQNVYATIALTIASALVAIFTKGRISPSAWLNSYSQTIPLGPVCVILLAPNLSGRELFATMLHECHHAHQSAEAGLRGRGDAEAEWGPFWLEYLRAEEFMARAEAEAYCTWVELCACAGWWGSMDPAEATAYGDNMQDTQLPAYGLDEEHRTLARQVFDSRALTALHTRQPTSPVVADALAILREKGLLA